MLTLAESIEERLQEIDRRPLRSEGTEDAQWLLLDYGDLVVHLFDAETRAYYDLERLWGNAPRVEFEPTPSAAGLQSNPSGL